MRTTVSTDLVRVPGVQADGEGIDVGELLNSMALPSITGMAASGPMSPRPSTAVPSGHHGDGGGLDRVLERLLAALRDRRAHARYSGHVGHGQVVARLQRYVEPGVDLPGAPVNLEGGVGDLHDTGGPHACTALITSPLWPTLEHSMVISRHVLSRPGIDGVHGDDRGARPRNRRRHPARRLASR
jgi:hypothetical protein